MKMAEPRLPRRFVGAIAALTLALLTVGVLASLAAAVPFMTATKASVLTVDNNGNGSADPGDVIRYDVTITNSGFPAADAVVFQDAIDPNTTLGGPNIATVKSTPIARNDSYSSLGNVGITVPAASGVLLNDVDPDGGSISVVVAAGGTSAGGAFSMSSNGSFAYLPPPGYEGTDQFTYSVIDADGNTDPATVSILVNEVIWFVDKTQASQGSGVLSSPFNDLGNAGGYNAAATDEAGDIIFVYHEGASGAYSGGITLQNNQKLIGQGATASIASIAGITVPPFSNTLPATGSTKPTITNTAGDGIVLAANNTVRGLAAGNAIGSSIAGAGVGTLVVGEVVVANATGGGLEIAGGVLSVALESLTTTSAADEGIDATNVTGSLTIPAGTISNSGSRAITIDGNPLALNVNLTSVSAAGATGGIVIADTTGSFSITGTGTTDGSGGTVQNMSGAGVHLQNATNVSLANMNLNFTAQSPPVTTGSPTCAREATGTNTSCVAAVTLINAGNVSLTNLTINDSNQHGINGNNVSGLSVVNTDLTNIGDTALENGLNFINLLGTTTLNNLTIDGSHTRNALIENNQGTAVINLTNSTINNATGEDGFHVVAGSSGANNANVTLNVTGSSFTHNHSVQLKAHAEDTSTVDVNVTGNSFDGEPTVVGNVGIDLAVRDNATLTFDVTGTVANPQSFAPIRSHAVNVFVFGGGSASGTVDGNTIEGTEVGAGVRAVAEVTTSGNPELVIDISDNSIQSIKGVGLAGIDIRSRQGVVAATGVANVQATVNNNTVGVTSTADANIQFYINSGNTLCAAVTNNAASGMPFFGDAFYVGNPVLGDPLGAGTAQLTGWTGNIDTTWNINGNTPSNSAFLDGTISGTCTPTVPPAAAAAGVLESAVDVANAHGPAAAVTVPGRSITGAAPRPAAEPAAAPGGSPTEQLLSGENLTVVLGALDPGQIVTITFEVTIDNPQSPATNGQVCNQGLVSGANFDDVLTDDPSTPTASDPTCTPLTPGTIIIAKDQSPNGSNTFGFTSSIPGNAAFNVTGDSSLTINNVPAGSYNVTEDDPGAGFFGLTGLTCDDGASAAVSATDLGTRTAAIKLEPGETVTCTFTNQLLASIEVVKVVDLNGSPPNGDTFDLLIDGTTEASGVGDGGTSGSVPVALGSHTVSETGANLGNYNTEIACVERNSQADLAFASGPSINTGPLSPGDEVLCTITNTLRRGSITVRKQTNGGFGTFTFSTDYLLGPIELTTSAAVNPAESAATENLLPGTYTVFELGPGAGWIFDGVTCDDDDWPDGTNDQTATIELDAAEDVTCTFTNTRAGLLELQLVVDPPGGSFDLFIDGAIFATGGSGTTTGERAVSVGSHAVAIGGDGSTNSFDYFTNFTCRDNDGAGSIVAQGDVTGTASVPVQVGADDDIVCVATAALKGHDLSATKTDGGGTFRAGETISYVISYANDGNLPASSVIISEWVPAHTVANLGASTPGWACNPAAGVAGTNCTINVGTLDPGGFGSVDFAVDVVSPLPPTATETVNYLGCEVTISGLCQAQPGIYGISSGPIGDLDPADNYFAYTTLLDPNRSPVASNDSYATIEDTALVEATVGPLGDGVLSNDTDPDGDPLTAVLDSGPSQGVLTLNSDGSFTYVPGANFCGSDSFTYHANDDQADSSPATVSITVICVDDPPVVAVDVDSQTVQYSDFIGEVTVTATDVDSHPLTISDDAPSNLATSGGCAAAGGGTSCSWTLSGQVLVGAADYDVTFTVSDAGSDATAHTEVKVLTEDATVGFDGSNPVAVEVDAAGSDSSQPFTLVLHVQEKSETGSVAPGDINLAAVSVTLQPVGPGPAPTTTCVSAGAVAQYDYTAVLEVVCDFAGVPVNTYTVAASVAGDFYSGAGEDVLTVYDPTLGFTTGGGWFYWPGTSDRTNFGYTMKYNKRATKVQGSLLVIRHLPDGSIYRLKSNAIDGLALGDGGAYGWATFSGKATYLGPGMTEPEGNHSFIVYVEDYGEPGAGSDRFWLQVQDKDAVVAADLSIESPAAANAKTIDGGNIVVPHQPRKGKGGPR